MKKSLLTIITFALVLVNLVLTAVTALTIVPEVGKVNALVAKISEAIDLDIAAGDEKTGGASISIDSIEPWALTENITVNLKKGDDGADHFAVLGITISKNTKSEAYATYSDLTSYEGVIRGEINSIVSSYTIEEMRENTDAVREEIKNRLNTLFASDLIAEVSFSTVNYQ